MPHEDQEFMEATALEGVNLAQKLGLVDADVNAATTVAALKTAIEGLAGHEDQRFAKVRISKGLDPSKATADLTDAEVSSATTVALLRAAMSDGRSTYGTRLPAE